MRTRYFYTAFVFYIYGMQDEPTFEDILAYFASKSGQLPEQLRLSDGENIIDLPKFVEAHTEVLKANTNNSVFMPYFRRLKKVFVLLNK